MSIPKCMTLLPMAERFSFGPSDAYTAHIFYMDRFVGECEVTSTGPVWFCDVFTTLVGEIECPAIADDVIQCVSQLANDPWRTI